LNPKVTSTNELYGVVLMATREWKDGLLSKTMRSLGQIPDTNPKWIVLDGDLDANWIESMNSVMDDNKLLTLASNERIPLKPHMRMIFKSEIFVLLLLLQYHVLVFFSSLIHLVHNGVHMLNLG